jgi:DNA-binding transcriptional LysR family regulator
MQCAALRIAGRAPSQPDNPQRLATEAGLELLSRLQATLSSLDEALDAVTAFRGQVAGTVRVNAPRVAAAALVRDILPRMAERFPDVTVDIVVESR